MNTSTITMEKEKLESFVEQAQKSILFTAPVLGKDMKRFLDTETERIKALAQTFVDEKVDHIYWVGSGNSWVNLYSGKYLLDQFTDVTSDVYTSYDFVTRDPRRLGKNSWVFLASFSGGTEDTVAALRYANNKGAKTIALVNKADSLMGKEAKEVVAYNSIALYLLPLAFAYLFSLEVAKLKGAAEVQEVIDGLYQLPDLLDKQFVDEKDKALKLAEKFLDEDLIYTMGSGPLYGLAYKFGLTVFMENMRINGSFMDATEFRHGPAEMFDRNKPAFIILKGTDGSRPLVERVCNLVEAQGCKLQVYDLKDYEGVHPLLAPFVLMIPLQWFAVYSSLMRGITDLDERVLMGHGIMGKGEGVTWP